MNTKEENKVSIIAYHADCIDGFTAAWAMWNNMVENGFKPQLFPMYYTEDSTRLFLNKMHEVYNKENGIDFLAVVDFSLDIKTLAYINGGFIETSVLILDHHKTAFEIYAPDHVVTKKSWVEMTVEGAQVILDNNESGASLCWIWAHEDKNLPRLISYVKDYDLWRFLHGDETKWVNKVLGKEAKTIENWDSIHDQMQDNVWFQEILARGKQLQHSHDFTVDALATHARSITIAGISGLAAECKDKQFVSDLGHDLCKNSGTFGAMYVIDLEANTVTWSLRSQGDFDVSRIAKLYGGGGHKNAAGFSVPLIPGLDDSQWEEGVI